MVTLCHGYEFQVIVICSFCHQVYGFDKFRSLVPNGGTGLSMHFAVGHVSAKGGGDLNAFGEDFLRYGKRWTRELCAADSDNDGQTNGHELGDPCCCWDAETHWKLRYVAGQGDWNYKAAASKYMHTFLRMENISAPGNSSSVSAAPISDCSVCPTQEDILALADADGHGWLWYETIRDKIDFVYFIITMLGMSFFFWPGFRLIALLKNLGFRGILATFLCTLLWLDMTGCLLHLVLDNEANRWYSLLKPQVEGFLKHHDDPQGIACRHPFAYACAHMGVLVPFLVVLYAGKLVSAVSGKWHRQKKQHFDMVFILFAIPGSVLMQFAHRWSHMPNTFLSPFISMLQHSGLFISASEHSIHHISPFNTRFSIMMGWADRIINPLIENVLHPKHPLWVPIFALWLCSPVVFTSNS